MKQIIYILIIILSGCIENELPSVKNYAAVETLSSKKISQEVSKINGRIIRNGRVQSLSIGFNIANKMDSNRILYEIRIPLDSINSDGNFSYLLTNKIGIEEEYIFAAVVQYEGIISRGIYQNLILGPYIGPPLIEITSISPQITRCGDIVTIGLTSNEIIEEVTININNRDIKTVKNVKNSIEFNVPNDLPIGIYPVILKIEGRRITSSFGFFNQEC